MMNRHLACAAVVACLAAFVGPAQGSSEAADATRIVFASDWAENLNSAELYDLDVSSGRRVRITATPLETEDAPALSPDGSHIAFVRSRDDVRAGADVVVAELDGRNPRSIAHVSGDLEGRQGIYPRARLAWSPDGRSIALVARGPVEEPGALYVAAVDGSGARMLAPAPADYFGTGPAWAPGGERLVFYGPDGLEVIDRDGGGRRVLGIGQYPAWAPNGSVIAFVGGNSGFDGDGIFLADPEATTPPEQIVSGPAVMPAWSPDGRALAFVRGSLEQGHVSVVSPDGGAEHAVADERSVAPAWSPDGRSIAFVLQRLEAGHEDFDRDLVTDEVHLVSPDGTNDRKVEAVRFEEVGQPVWTPNGRRLIYSAKIFATDPEIYVVNLDGTGVRALTNNVLADREPAWSPGHRQIAFVRDQWRSIYPYEGCRFCPQPWIYVMSDRGTNVRRLVRGSHPAWSPDGSKIAFDNGYEIYVMSARGGKRKLVAKNREWRSEEPTWSPDGRRIAFDLAGRIAVIASNGGRARYLTPPDKGEEVGSDWVPAWSPQGSLIAFGRRTGICLLSIKARSVRCLRRADESFSPDWSPDGSRLVFDTYQPRPDHHVLMIAGLHGGERLLRDATGNAFQPDW